MCTAQFCTDGISLFIEQDVGTHTLYITESDMMSCLFIIIMMKCDKGNKLLFVVFYCTNGILYELISLC